MDSLPFSLSLSTVFIYLCLDTLSFDCARTMIFGRIRTNHASTGRTRVKDPDSLSISGGYKKNSHPDFELCWSAFHLFKILDPMKY